ncbi:MAG: DUF7713 domain-containing protein [Archangium sp.]
MRRPHIASLEEVRITRQGDVAIIENADPRVSTTHFQLGPEVQEMTDQQILDCFNESIRAREQLATKYEHVALEIPLGKPQIEYFERSHQWTPRGNVIRCLIDDGGPADEPIIYVDDHELSWHEFGRLLCTYAGWGMRVFFVPDTALHEQPQLEVHEPGDMG